MALYGYVYERPARKHFGLVHKPGSENSAATIVRAARLLTHGSERADLM